MPAAPRARRSSLPGRFGPAVPAIPEPAELSRVSLLPAVSAGAPPSIRPQLEGPEPAVAASRRSALVEVTTTWAVRGDAVRGLLAHGAAFTNTPLLRRMRGRDLNEPLGGPGSPWVLLSGAGQILVGASPERELSALELSSTFVYVRESCLVGYAGTAQHENGRLPTGGGEPVSMVQITGRGTVLIESRKPPRVLEVTENQKLAVRADRRGGLDRSLARAPVGLGIRTAQGTWLRGLFRQRFGASRSGLIWRKQAYSLGVPIASL